jgi:uncharacterized membrane protein
VLWLAIVLAIKVGLYRRGVVTGDLFIYANAFANTHLPHRLLYIADYQLTRGATSLVLDHFEPSTVLLIPFYWLFRTPLFFVVLQALAPAVLAAALVVLARRLTGRAWPGWMAAVATLYNPLFSAAVIDGIYGFHHDAQYLVYAPLFIAMFLLRRYGWAAVFFALFLGVKEDAAFFGIAFGIALAVFDAPGGGFRKPGLMVAAVSAAYFAATVLVLPELIASPNIYANASFAELHQGVLHVVATTWDNFFARKWHDLWLYFWLAFGNPAFVLAGVPDLVLFSMMTRDANHYFDFTIVTFLALGVLLTLIGLRDAQSRWRRLIVAAFAVQLVLCVPLGLADLHHVWARNIALAQAVSAADATAAEGMVDPACSVSVSAALLPWFYRATYWFQWENAGHARFIVTTSPDPSNPLPDDQVTEFAATHAAQLDRIGQSGAVTVWRNRAAPCLPW